ncbi:MAG: YbaB/EbfC family nucleoid-associated protein [Chitinophagales bacterium]|nr:YbaB/EbfC family nucleoid-associated protein [Chitinophagales bacterium]
MGFFDQMKQLNEMKSKMEDIKRKMDELEIIEENQFLKVVVSGNRKIKTLEIKDTTVSPENMVQTINRALEKTDAEVQKQMMGAMPNIPGLG